MTLYTYVQDRFDGEDAHLNCAERMLYGANAVYGLGLDKKALLLAAPFGSGMGTGRVCGAVVSSLMVISELLVREHAHQEPRLIPLEQRFFRRYEQAMGAVDCAPLRRRYRTKEHGCRSVILEAAKLLDEMLVEEGLVAQNGD